MKILETKRLRLRQFVPEDAATLFDIYQGEDVMKYIGDTPENVEKTQDNLSQLIGHYETWGYGLWATTLKENDALIGRCGLLNWDLEGCEETEVAYLIGREHWGKGYGTEAAQGIVKYAFKTLGLNRLIALIHRRNKASLQVASKMTMDFESTIRFKGQLVCLYALDLDYSGTPEYFNYI